MNVILFGATGMVGQSVLRECLADPSVAKVLSIGRRPSGQANPKLAEMVRANLADVAAELNGYDACFFCLGVTSMGMSEADYRKVTVDIAAAAAKTLVAQNPRMTFIYVSGTGTDSTGTSKTMWARVKGEGENAIFALPFKGKFAFRPGFIRPAKGIVSRTASYRVLYAVLRPLTPLAKVLLPHKVTSSEQIGRAMLNVARRGFAKPILDSDDINEAAGPAPS